MTATAPITQVRPFTVIGYSGYRDGAVMLSMLAESGDLASRAVQRST